MCTRKAPGSCVPLLDPATGDPQTAGFACYRDVRPPCPCPYGWCHRCKAVIAGASTLPLYDDSPEIDLDPDIGDAEDGHMAVRELADGTLAVRRLGAGQVPGDGWRRAREHACGSAA
jgi:hypothetical protein